MCPLQLIMTRNRSKLSDNQFGHWDRLSRQRKYWQLPEQESLEATWLPVRYNSATMTGDQVDASNPEFFGPALTSAKTMATSE
jgi:hypothetical protein